MRDMVRSKDRLFYDICERLSLNPDNEFQLIKFKQQLNICTVIQNKVIEWLEELFGSIVEKLSHSS